MRFCYLLAPFLLAGPALAGVFGRGNPSSVPPPKPTSSSSSNSGSQGTSSEVAFLQTLQAAQVASMSCLITLVNLTTTPLGTCLGLASLADLIANPSQNASYSTQLNGYLGTVCGQTCSEAALNDGKAQLTSKCDMGNGLVGALGAIIENYSSSYRTLACQVHYNGTSDLCLPATLNTSTTANSNVFLNALLRGSNTDLESYRNSVFTQAKCTGCMYEMFKAAQYTIPGIRGKPLTEAFGNHLKYDCPSSPDNPYAGSSTGGGGSGSGSVINWADVNDQQIPDALQVSQNTRNPNGAMRTIKGTTEGSWGMEIVIATALLVWTGTQVVL
ncbi:hypothetical protein L204_102687 [Cryptococcus depauperatus]|nr:hypothetical protein L204_00562 [Cryptococcus depauperatus CBS 7855]